MLRDSVVSIGYRDRARWLLASLGHPSRVKSQKLEVFRSEKSEVSKCQKSEVRSRKTQLKANINSATA